jgi:hypothetical protein
MKIYFQSLKEGAKKPAYLFVRVNEAFDEKKLNKLVEACGERCGQQVTLGVSVLDLACPPSEELESGFAQAANQSLAVLTNLRQGHYHLHHVDHQVQTLKINERQQLPV